MKSKLVSTLIILIVLGILLAQPAPVVAREGLPPRLIIATTPNGDPVQSIQIPFDSASTSATIHLYVRHSETDELSGIKFSVANITLKGSNELAGGYTITFSVNGVAIPEAGLTLPSGKEILVEMAMSGFSQTGDFTGTLTATILGITDRSVGLDILHRAKPNLSISGLAETETGLTQETNNLDYSFTIISTNQTEVTDLQVSVDDFKKPGNTGIQPVNIQCLDSNGKGLNPTDCSGVYSLTGLEMMGIRFSLNNMTEEGAYLGRIRLVYNGNQYIFPIRVTRTRSPVSLTILGLDDPVLGTTTCKAPSICPGIQFRLILSENKGQDVTIQPPLLLDLDNKVNDTLKHETSLATLAVNTTDPTMTYTINARSTRILDMKITGIEQAGEYLGVIEVSDSNGAPVTHDITIKVREPVYIAILCILISLCLSLGIRAAIARIPLLEFRIKIQQEREALEKIAQGINKLDQLLFPELLKKSLTALCIVLDERLNTLYKLTYNGIKVENQEMKNELEDIEATHKLLPNLVDLAQAIHNLPLVIQKQKDYTALVDKYIKTLSDPVQSANIRNDLKTLRETGVLQSLKEYLEKNTGDPTIVEGLYPLLPKSADSKDFKELNTYLTKNLCHPAILAVLYAHHMEFPQNELFKMELRSYFKMFSDIQPGDAVWFAVPGTANQPVWIQWKNLRSGLLGKVQIPLRFSLLNDMVILIRNSYDNYLQATARLAIQHLAPPVEKEWGSLLQLVCDASPDGHQKSGLFEDYINAFGLYTREIKEEVSQTIQDRKGRLELDTWSSDGKLRKNIFDTFRTALWWNLNNNKTSLPPSIEIAKLKNYLLLIQVFQYVIAFLITAIAGWYILYYPDLTWGGWGSRLIAVFWGLGLTEITNGSLTGFKKFTGLDSVLKTWVTSPATTTSQNPSVGGGT